MYFPDLRLKDGWDGNLYTVKVFALSDGIIVRSLKSSCGDWLCRNKVYVDGGNKGGTLRQLFVGNFLEDLDQRRGR
jgi:hypothetical protein